MKRVTGRIAAGLVSSAVFLSIGVTADGALAAPAAQESVRLVVGFHQGIGDAASAQSLAASGLRMRSDDPLRALGARSVQVSRQDSARLMAELRRDPAVRYVELDGRARKDVVTPNDPRYGEQTELPQIGIPAAWSGTTGSAAVTVAVVDTGVSGFGDVAGSVLAGWDFVNGDGNAADDEGHGTAVASLIAGRGNNGVGIAGACWSCRILPVKVLDALGNGSYSEVAAGITYAADRGAKIINLSLGGPSASTVLQQATDYARAKGAIVLAAAGNDALRQRHYPAANAGVIAIGGTNATNGRFVVFDPSSGRNVGTNYGADWVDVAAPFCTTALNLPGFGGAPADDYSVFCGTSASTPLVSGVAALVKSRNPQATAWALERSLTATALPLTGNWVRNGQVRADRAVVGVDRIAPKIAGVTPKQSARFRGTVTVGATGVSDAGGSGLSHATLYANGKYVGRDAATPYSFRYASGRFSGTVKLLLRVYDRAGNSTVLTRVLVADNTPPKVTITKGPKHNAKVKGTVTVAASASDAAGIARVELLINGKVVAKDTRAAYSFKVKVAKYGKKIKVQVRAVDRVGNIGSAKARTWKR